MQNASAFTGKQSRWRRLHENTLVRQLLAAAEQESSHAGCETWSRAFTNRAAFDAFIAENAALKNAKPLTFKEWSERQGEKPDTYVKPKGPVENPYAGHGSEAHR